jgi:EmrB/QacA subfamily drug resistance transporter
MIVLDVTIVNVALPGMQRNLHFSASGLQWVVSAYTLFFGGFLLLGGRTADLLGRRRVFLIGLALFGVASLAGGLAQNSEQLIAFRAAQGLGGAMMSPAAFAILTVTYAHGRARNIAVGVWGGLAGLGGTAGAVAGGALVDSLSWRWVLLVNVPVAIAVAAVVPLLVAESKAESPAGAKRSFDVVGALLSTAGLLAIALGVIRSDATGWSSFQVIGLLILGVLLLVSFVRVERRSPAPLVPLTLFRSRGLTMSIMSLALVGAAFLAMFYLTAVWLQQARELSALRTGLYFIPMGLAAIVSAMLSAPLVTRFGTKPIQLAGSVLSAIGLLLLSRADLTSSYATGLLPGLILFGFGIIAVNTPATVTAVADIRHDQAGAASGVLNAGYQVGGALGVAVITTLATSHTTALARAGETAGTALSGGFDRGLLVAAAFALANIVFALAAPHVHATEAEVAEAAVAA